MFNYKELKAGDKCKLRNGQIILFTGFDGIKNIITGIFMGDIRPSIEFWHLNGNYIEI